MKCEECKELLLFYACGELEGKSRAEVEAHIATCAGCAAALEQEKQLLEALVASEPVHDFEVADSPAARLLAECRAGLADALDRLERPSLLARLWQQMRVAEWLTARPALGAAFLILLGIVLGQSVPLLLQRPTPAGGSDAAIPVYGLPESARDLSKLNVEGINWSGTPEGGEVTVRFRQEDPRVLRGTLDNPDVRQLLMHVLENGQRFDSGLRMDSVEALKARSDDAEVRQTLCRTARQDRNPAIRLKAMEAVRSFGEDPQVREALLEALTSDSNPGVRVEAVTALRTMAENGEALPQMAGDARLVAALRKCMQKDPNTYVRLQSAAAMRKINSPETH